MIVMWTLAALAADPTTGGAVGERYPWQATVTFDAPVGVHRVDVPPELRSYADPSDGSDLMLVDATGRVVPVAWARTDLPPEAFPLSAGSVDHDVYTIGKVDRPLDGVDVNLPGDGAATVAIAWDGGAADGLVWRLGTDAKSRVDLPPGVTGPLTVTFAWHQRPTTGSVAFLGLRDPAQDVGPSELVLPVADSRIEERGWARYTVDLPHPLPILALRPLPEGDVFERGAMVRAAAMDEWDWPYASATLARVHLGGATADRLRVPVTLEATSTVVLYVDATGREALVIPSVAIELPGESGFVRDPGPGPHLLYGGAPPGTTPPFDLAVALPELARSTEGRATVGPVEANPGHVPPEIRSGIGLPGPTVDADFAWRRAVAGAGLSRVPLDADVLRHARSDLGDVRLVDGEGRQIPFVLRRVAADHPMDVALQRTEDGPTSRLVLTLPDDRPVSTVTLHTDAPLFNRQITVFVGRGNRLEPVRTFSWSGMDRPAALTLDVGQAAGDQLVVGIDNGSNPPLPISRVAAAWPAWEVVAVLPPAGAELRYGAPRLSAPIYDFELLGADVVARATAVATLAAPVAVAPPPRSWWDELVLLAGLGVLALGLLGLTVALVRGVPDEPAPDPEPEAT